MRRTAAPPIIHMTHSAVSVDDVRRVAELANLELTAEEETRMLRDLNAILEHVSQLNELDTSAVAPLAQVSEVIGSSPQSVLRPDEVAPSLDRGVVMASQLIALGLVDEFYFIVIPIFAGGGRRLLDGVSLQERLQLRLVETKVLKSGCVALHYLKQ